MVVWLENILPPSHISSEGGRSRLAFRAREGVVMWLENIPSVSHFERGRVMVMWEEETSPLSRASSEGGGSDVVGKHPLLLALRAREGDGDVGRGNVPSVSRFERGRG